jgi:hypothetical protein
MPLYGVSVKRRSNWRLTPTPYKHRASFLI